MKIPDLIQKNKSFILGILILVSFRWSLADQYRVPSGSMEPTIQIGDHLGVYKAAYDLKVPLTNWILFSTENPERGDIVVFIWPGDGKTTFVKRLIGLPGDHLQVSNGFIKINGYPLETSQYQKLDLNTQIYQEKIGTHTIGVQRLTPSSNLRDVDLVVPHDSYFFMGDNRDNSLDSRAWGVVKREALKGKVVRILWNLKFNDMIPTLDLSRVLSKLP